MRDFLKSLFNNILKGSNNEDNDDCLKKIFNDKISTLYQINSEFENGILNDNPFIITITFNPTKKFIDYFLKSKIIIKLTYEGLYKKLNDARSIIIENERIKEEESENDCELYLFHTIIGDTNDIANFLGEVSKAVHQVGRMPFEEFINQYKNLIEDVCKCRIIENSYYAINTKIDIDKTTNEDEYLVYILAKSIILENNTIVESFRSSQERQRFADYLNQFTKELCLFILFDYYYSLNDEQKKDYTQYYQNIHLVSDYCIKENSVFEFSNDMQNRYNIQHFIKNQDGMDYYFFSLNVIDDYLSKKVRVENINECVKFIYGRLSVIVDIECCGTAQTINEITYESNMIKILSHYDAKILSNLTNKFFASYFNRQMDVIRDYIQEEVKNQLKFD